MAVPKLEVVVVRSPRGRVGHALGRDGRAECGRVAARGWRPCGRGRESVDCAGCRAAMVVG